MRVLTISIDESIFSSQSKSFSRLLWQSSFVEEMIVLVLKTRGNVTYVQKGNLKIFSTKSACRPIRWIEARELGSNLIKKYKPDIITCQDPFFCGLLGYILTRGTKIGLHIQLHGDFFSNIYWRNESCLNRIKYYLGLKILKKADSLRVVSQRIKDDLLRREIPVANIIEVPIYIDIERLKLIDAETLPDIELRKFENLFLFVGRFSKEKNLEMLIMAFEKHLHKYTTSGLILVGDGLLGNELRDLVKELGIHKNVIFKRWQESLAIYYKQAKALVLPSYYEGWGRVCVEALAFSTPVIMTDVGCARQLVIDGFNGVILPIGNADKLVEALDRFAQDSEFHRKLSLNAPASLKKLFSEEETKKLYLESWQKALKK